MLLKDRINADFIEAFKTDKNKKNFLGVLKGAIQTQEGKNIDSTDDNVLKVIKSMEKGINETIEGLKSTNSDTTEQELELSYLKPYLPEMMSENAIREAVRLLIIESNGKNAGIVMGAFSKAYKNADMKLVTQIVKEELV